MASNFNIRVLFLCFISFCILSACSSKSIPSKDITNINSRTDSTNYSCNPATSGRSSNMTEHRILVPEIDVTEKLLPLEIKFPEQTIKLDGVIKPLEGV